MMDVSALATGMNDFEMVAPPLQQHSHVTPKMPDLQQKCSTTENGDDIIDDQKVNDVAQPIFMVRYQDGVSTYLNGNEKPHFSLNDEILHALWSPDGTHLLVNGLISGICVYHHEMWQRRNSSKNLLHNEEGVLQTRLAKLPNAPAVPARSVRHLQWSPKGTFVVAFWQYDLKALAAGQDDRNVAVWKVVGGGDSNNNSIRRKEDNSSLLLEIQPIASFTLKGVSLGQWPILKWRNDEKFCLLCSRSEVVVYDGQDVGGASLMRIPLSGAISASVAPVLPESVQAAAAAAAANPPAVSPPKSSDSLTFAAFSPASSPSEPDALFRIVHVPEVKRGALQKWKITVNKPLGTTDSAEVTWSPSGSMVLVLANTTVDSAGENYGEVGDVYLARYDGSLTVKMNKLVVQEACWNPCRDEFVVIEGKSPSEMCLYDRDCNIQFEFPVAYRNTIRFDSFGLMVALGGFGNLAGDISFWYRDSETRSMKIIADWRESCTVLCDWSPDGRHFFTASTYPRMKVDNQLKIFTYEGHLSMLKPFSRLLDVQWKPEGLGFFHVPPRPQQQPSAIVAMKKFKCSRDLLSDAAKAEAEKKRVAAQRNRKEQTSGLQGSAVASKGAIQTVPTAAQAARMEKNRQLDSIADWRRAPKDVETVTDAAAVSKRRGSKKVDDKKDSPTDSQATDSPTPRSTPATTGTNDASSPSKSLVTQEGLKTLSQQHKAFGPISELPSSTGQASAVIRGETVSLLQPELSQTISAGVAPLSHTNQQRLPSQKVQSQPSQPTQDDADPQAKVRESPNEWPQQIDNAVQKVTVNANVPPTFNPETVSRAQAQRQQPSSATTGNVLPRTGAIHPIQPSVPLQSPKTGLLGLLKSILPPDASLHVARDHSTVPSASDSCEASQYQYDHEFPLLGESRPSPPSQYPCQLTFPDSKAPTNDRSVNLPPPPPRQPHMWNQSNTFGTAPTQANKNVEDLGNLISLLKAQRLQQQQQQLQQQQLLHQQAQRQRQMQAHLHQHLQRSMHQQQTQLLRGSADSRWPLGGVTDIEETDRSYAVENSDAAQKVLDLFLQGLQPERPAGGSKVPNASLGVNLPTRNAIFRTHNENPTQLQRMEQLKRQLQQARENPEQRAALVQALLRIQQQSQRSDGLQTNQQPSQLQKQQVWQQQEQHLGAQSHSRGQQQELPDHTEELNKTQQSSNLEAAPLEINQKWVSMDQNREEMQYQFRESLDVSRNRIASQHLLQASQHQQLPTNTRPNPNFDRCWEYLDPKGVIRGPFDITDMRKWCSMGYFEPSLPIRCCPTDKFVPLCQLFPLGSPFGVIAPKGEI